MPSTVDDVLFGEPAGRPNSLVQFASAFAFLSIHLYFYVYLGVRGTSGSWLLVMAFATMLSGIAESLPIHRRKIAGALRLTAILTFVCLIVAVVLAPDIVTG
jgi:hypothetical protein